MERAHVCDLHLMTPVLYLSQALLSWWRRLILSFVSHACDQRELIDVAGVLHYSAAILETFPARTNYAIALHHSRPAVCAFSMAIMPYEYA